MQKEHPILFSTEMVKAILEGRKTQTRRIIKSKHESGMFAVSTAKYEPNCLGYYHNRSICSIDWDERTVDGGDILCPYGEVGDLIYVRESHFRYGKWVKNGATKTGKQKWKFVPDNQFPNFRYQDNAPEKVQRNSERVTGWYKRSSLFMPKEFTRIWLDITDIKIERLQDISEEDAKAEGVQENKCTDEVRSKCISTLCKSECIATGEYYRYPVDFDTEPCYSARESFESLWQSINGRESWQANPWVWVISFKRIDKPTRQE